ncbi:MAG: N(4)-(beta-N-acetylglucosaminyl)-L-asparaginase [Ignavibacteria bacterium]|nr:N(4)-(beta-N-acetylglucosaminyl)-L-asparaginase [Ignavibacteria bacterium]MBK7033011.1 N(4)-(beta-N-acetylglucosaminyl)-L-asparaginase [Ignavibacteria bacterium]MBK7184687.1 N(4)-(beta-N-acetylglucosaminyl)-L-asparaginase [Ignavibacteria bacterium]MBK7576989.1 N(4)-(beta-N-acetylglucosaminyl)-L-asparaginase [Ignavibacteria bacterium]MBK9182940.1 N(4)-(beta-N-acetylglucosaminyl)-L-asparaginase [Ignavibacteria bacterium]
MNRRSFIAASVGVATLASTKRVLAESSRDPLVISTWDHGLPANKTALQVLGRGGSVLDAVERGVMVVESDPNNLSVGLGGLPDRDGIVTLDASIMTGDCRAGSVCFVQGIPHPITVARLVMERTPHVMLVGSGAERFAREQGVSQLTNTLTRQARAAWEEWCKEKKYTPVINIENHDTIGLLAMDANGKMAGACTTSGLAYKVHGRVGDSPIIGAGLYVDDEVGAATCTGLGETVLRTLASFLAVERMRMGDSPQAACETAIKRIVAKHTNYNEFQVGILAIDTAGRHGAFSIQKGFTYALNDVIKESAYFAK